MSFDFNDNLDNYDVFNISDDDNNNEDDYIELNNNNDKYMYGLNDNEEEFIVKNYKLKRKRTGGKDSDMLYEQYLNHIRENPDDNKHTVRIRKYPRKKERKFEIKSFDKFNKDSFIKSIHNSIDPILNKYLLNEDTFISKFKMSFEEKSEDDKKIRKPRTKKVYKVLDENIIEMRNLLFKSSKLIYPIFLSTEKENDINLIFPLINNNNTYNTFIDLFFTTGNLYFFLNMEKNIINIPNLPTYAFYRALQRGEGRTINRYFIGGGDVNYFPEQIYEEFKINLNNLLKEYEKNINNEKIENQIAAYYYFLTKNVNKQTLKYRNEQVISKYNSNNTYVTKEHSIEDFFVINLLSNTTILNTEEYYNMIIHYDNPQTIIFIDLMKKPLDYYKPIGYDEDKFFALFEKAQSCMILVLPNTYFNRETFHDYIKDINDYKNDRKNYSLNRTINNKKQLIVCNKFKFF
jgi:hypothetical protein